MFEDFDECRNRIDHLIHMIEALSNTKRQLSMSALDFQALALAKKSQKEDAIQQADDVGELLELLIDLLNQVIVKFYHLSK